VFAAMLGPNGRIGLREKQWFNEADIKLWKPGAISGRVLDEFGEPMVATYVRAIARQMVAGRAQFIAGPVALTDDRGEYRIPNLPPGQYLVQVPSVQTTVATDMPTSTFQSG
jgi:protocatechuate 3,4-dioxygenase beta subunit